MFRNRVYYRIKPAIPRSLRLSIRRWFALRQRARVQDIWPIAPGSQQPPQNWAGWPGGKKFALVLTHDVESQYGLDKCRQLMKLEKGLDFRSSFNFIPKGGYEVPEQLRNELVRNGFEVGVHDLRHDGKLYHTRAEFSKNAALINEYLRDWQAVGFRSGFMLHNLNWLHDLNIEYDASTFDTDPFEPQPDHRNTIFPFWMAAPSDSQNPRGGYVEMPYTLPQDSTLFLLFREKTPEVWLRKLDWIAQHGGMVLLNTHPDYINFENKRSGREYPAAFYLELLEYIRSKYKDQYWHASPRDVASYVRADVRAAAAITKTAARTAIVNVQPVATKVWVDLDNTPHVPFFEPLMREFRARGYDVLCTARDAFQVCDLARQRGVEFQQVGRHSGKNRIRKAFGLFYRALQLLPLALREKPAIAISHGSRAQIIACKLLNIPSVLIEDYEHADYPPSMRPRWEIVPESIGDEGLCCAPDHARRYPGIKEHVYVRNFRPDAAVLTKLGLKEQHLIVTVRPPATEAHYHTDRGESLFFEMMSFLLNDPRVRIVLMPRNGKQADWIRQNKPGWFSNSRVVIPNGPMDGLNVIFHSDLVVSGGGTMNREAAALGVPAYSILAGKVGAVDRALERSGQLTMVTSAKDFVQKIKLVRRPRPLKLPSCGAGAFESIMTHLEEILSLEHTVKSIRRVLPAGAPSAEPSAVRAAS
jgi:predicted glycosyltransferase